MSHRNKTIQEACHENTSNCLNNRDRFVDIFLWNSECRGPDTNRENGGMFQSAWKADVKACCDEYGNLLARASALDARLNRKRSSELMGVILLSARFRLIRAEQMPTALSYKSSVFDGAGELLETGATRSHPIHQLSAL